MIRFTVLMVMRSTRAVAVLLLFVVWASLVFSMPGPPLTNASSMFGCHVIVGCWMAVIVGNIDGDAHRELLTASVGSPARLHVVRAVSGLVAVSPLVALTTALTLSTKTSRHSNVSIALATLALEIGGSSIGVGIGTFLHRPVLRRIGIAILIAVTAVVLLYLFAPMQAVLRAYNHDDVGDAVVFFAVALVATAGAVSGAATIASRRR